MWSFKNVLLNLEATGPAAVCVISICTAAVAIFGKEGLSTQALTALSLLGGLVIYNLGAGPPSQR